jgi:hypothetical protein
MVDGSRPDCLLVEGVADGRESEFLDPSTLSLFIASLKRFDIGSGHNVNVNSWETSPKTAHLCRSSQVTARLTWDGSSPFAVGPG